MVKRFFDIACAITGIILLLPLFLILLVVIPLDSKGPVFYFQHRVGRNNRDFRLVKFRTMHLHADQAGLITIGINDPRITRTGSFLRKYKIDELPQLLNVLKGEMSMVGPRPEVRKYVNQYNPEQLRVLSIRPGLTDFASLEYIHENEILASYSDPERAYTDIIMPAKLKLNLRYLDSMDFRTDLKIIGKTIQKVFH